MRSNLSYKRHLTLIIFSALFLSYLCLTVTCIKIYNDSIYELIEDNLSSVLNDSKDNIDKTIHTIHSTSQFLIKYSSLNEILSADDKQDVSCLIDANSDIYDVLSALYMNIDIKNIKIYSNNPNIYSMNIIVKGLPFEPEFIESLRSGTPAWIITEQNYERYLSFFQMYYTNIMYTNVLEISIPISSFEDSFSSIEYANTYMTLKTKDFSQIISYSNSTEKLPDIEELSKKNSFVFEKELNNVSGSLNIYINKHDVLKKYTVRYLRLIALILFGFILIGSFYYVIFKRMTYGLEIIVNSVLDDDMKKIENAKLNFKEFKIISDYFVRMKKRLEEQNKSRLSLELDVLGQRLSPHFLYNNLSALKSVDSGEKAEEIIDSLILYYRNAFQKGATFCTLEQEMLGINEYLKLLSISYEKDFDYSLDMPEELSGILMPVNILQPFVENAFIHGINTLKDKHGLIYISAEQNGDSICIVISDNAGAFRKEAYDSLDGDSAVGIVKKHLDLYYGSNYSIEYISTSDETSAVITLPLHRSDDN